MDSLVIPELPTLKDINIREKRVFIRIDINTPIDPETGEIIDDRRIRVHSKYLKEIVEKHNPALVLGSHQGRPGEPDFTTLEKHRDLIAKYTGFDVKFVDDVIGPKARDEIQKLKPGEILLLDNLRLVSEEVIEAIPEKQSYTLMVKRLAPLFDYYVNDAFATAHRSQPSIVGFPLVLPSAIGPLFEKELEALRKAFTNLDQPRVFVLGGVKVYDMLRVIENLVKYKLADRILTTGVLAQLFLVAKGAKIGQRNMQLLEEKGSLPLIHRARSLLLRGAPVETPIDFKTSINGNVRNEYLGRVEGEIKDIGEETVRIYCEFMKEARVIIMRGPAGVVEEPSFREGTVRILEAAVKSNAFVLIAGGHLSSMVREDLLRENVHVSTAGNAILLYLSGEQLPAIKALEISARIFHQK